MGSDLSPAAVLERLQPWLDEHYGTAGANLHPQTMMDAKQCIEHLAAALTDIVGLLDDPTGGEHVADMRMASERAREALGPEFAKPHP